jgi:hypothetical protein
MDADFQAFNCRKLVFTDTTIRHDLQQNPREVSMFAYLTVPQLLVVTIFAALILWRILKLK